MCIMVVLRFSCVVMLLRCVVVSMRGRGWAEPIVTRKYGGLLGVLAGALVVAARLLRY